MLSAADLSLLATADLPLAPASCLSLLPAAGLSLLPAHRPLWLSASLSSLLSAHTLPSARLLPGRGLLSPLIHRLTALCDGLASLPGRLRSLADRLRSLSDRLPALPERLPALPGWSAGLGLVALPLAYSLSVGLARFVHARALSLLASFRLAALCCALVLVVSVMSH